MIEGRLQEKKGKKTIFIAIRTAPSTAEWIERWQPMRFVVVSIFRSEQFAAPQSMGSILM